MEATCAVAEVHERKLGAAYGGRLTGYAAKTLGQMPTLIQWCRHFASYLTALPSPNPVFTAYLQLLAPSAVDPYTMESLKRRPVATLLQFDLLRTQASVS